jgi:23S rRNA pseudouridine1911/1915/1917 synthase
LTADRGDAGVRIDLVLRRHLTDVRTATRTSVQAWIQDGLVAINGETVHRVSRRAAHGDVVTVRVPAEARSAPEAVEDARAPAPLHILYEDDDLIAVDKPAGMVVHPTYKNGSGTLMDALRQRAGTWPSGQRPSLVSRLDRLTSGVLVVAKSPAVHAMLQREMTVSVSEKDYLAVVYGRVKLASGTIDLRLGFDANDRRKIVVAARGGVRSTTRFERIATAGGLSLLRCRLLTGRRHQIRVHLAARGWPIVGDDAYLTVRASGEPRWSQIRDAALAGTLRAFGRQALHAWRIAFTHPIAKRRLVVEAPLPADMRNLVSAAGLAFDREALVCRRADLQVREGALPFDHETLVL